MRVLVCVCVFGWVGGGGGLGGWVCLGGGGCNVFFASGACYTSYNTESMQVCCLMCMVMGMEILILCLDDWRCELFFSCLLRILYSP